MDRDEFIDLLTDELSEDPDNNRLNRILEAADEYAENEKAQLSCEGTTKGTTSDLISRQAAIDAIDCISGVEEVLRSLPTIQPQSTTGQLNDGVRSTNLIDRQETIDRFNVIRHVDPKKDECTKGIDVGIAMCIVAVKDQPTIPPVATDINVGDKISKFIDDIEKTFAYIREREGGDSVCGLCEYDGAYIGESGDWCNECPGFNRDDCFKLSDETRRKWTDEIIKALPTVQPELHEGEWIDYTEDGYVECPFCHSATNCDGNKDELHFCFSCGADMRGEQDETD